ncbi:MAG: ParB/RepB/Spo0J family partition protein [Candidatus Omnitrophica bacterium]|nr:ParB/RepB/Spo0J family partition protein [Candidatus Omnitrophota bacterium]
MDNKALGKGLAALIPQKKEMSSLDNSGGEGVLYLKTSIIKDNRLQPRQNYDESKLAELVASIKEKGLLQPILVRKAGPGYEVIAGERRLRAARKLNFDQVPVIVKNVTDREALVLALVENIQREELNPIEEAQGFKRLVDEFQFTQEAVAGSIGKDRTTVTNLLRLLRLPLEIQEQVAADQISVGHARALLSIEDPKVQKALAKKIVAKNLSVRQTEALVRSHVAPAKKKAGRSKDRDIQILEEEIGRILGTRVMVEDRKNKGRVVIEYYSLDDLDRILGILRK